MIHTWNLQSITPDQLLQVTGGESPHVFQHGIVKILFSMAYHADKVDLQPLREDIYYLERLYDLLELLNAAESS